MGPDSQKREICDWFQKTNPSPNHNDAKDLYVGGTGDWVLRSLEWTDWLSLRTRAVWMYGIPGAGKTVLAAHLIEEIDKICNQATDRKLACVYFYCYHGHNQDEALPFLRWLISQLFRKANKIPDSAYTIFKEGREPDIPLLLSVLAETLQYYEIVFVMVDALDESRPRENILNLLHDFITDNRFSNIQLFATSREYTDIRRAMSNISTPLSLSNPLVESDIKSYIAAEISSNRAFRLWPNSLRVEVEERLSKGARGMFRWAVCQLDILRRLKDLDRIREAIVSLPETLDETYERIFSYIHRDDRELVRHAIRWICFHNILWPTEIPLATSTLVDAYVMCTRDSQMETLRLVDIELLKESCGCLVTYYGAPESEKAVLAHYTVREFLESDRTTHFSSFFQLHPDDIFKDVQRAIFRHALASRPFEVDTSNMNLQDYCFFSSLRAIKVLEEDVDPSLAFQFLDHATSPYPFLQSEEVSTDVFDDEQYCWQLDWSSLDADNPALVCFIQLIELECFRLAALYLQEHGVKKVLESEFSVGFLRRLSCLDDEETGPWLFHGNVLEYCAVYTLSVSMPLDTKFAFCVEQGAGLVDFTSILPAYSGVHWSCACREGKQCILKELLRLGALPDPKGYRVTPLQILCSVGDVRGVQVLLEAGADPNSVGDEGGIMWNEASMLHRFQRFHGVSPLRIIRTMCEPQAWCHSTQEVEPLLLQYRARDFDSQSYCQRATRGMAEEHIAR